MEEVTCSLVSTDGLNSEGSSPGQRGRIERVVTGRGSRVPGKWWGLGGMEAQV